MMTKVVLTNVAMTHSAGSQFTWNDLKMLKQWCRDQFGVNPRSGPRIWTSTYYPAEAQPGQSMWQAGWNPVFYFADPKHASLFVLRWS